MADWSRWRYSCLVIIQFLQYLKTVGFVTDSPLYLNLRCAHIMITKIDETAEKSEMSDIYSSAQRRKSTIYSGGQMSRVEYE